MSLLTKEWPWAIHSHRSLQKSNVSKSLSVLFKKELCEWFACDSSELLPKTSDALKNSYFCMFLTVFHLFMPKSESLPSLFAHLLFFFKRPWAIWLGLSWQKSDGRDPLFFTNTSLFRSHKTSKSLKKPMSVFPTLKINILKVRI